MPGDLHGRKIIATFVLWKQLETSVGQSARQQQRERYQQARTETRR